MQRWTSYKKRSIVQRIADGIVSKAEAVALLDLSMEELEGWIAAFGRFGIQGLKVQNTKVVRLLA